MGILKEIIAKKNMNKLVEKAIEFAEAKNHHNTQVPKILKYLKEINISEHKLVLITKILQMQEKILWGIDDAVDDEYLGKKEKQKYIYYDEITKFVLFVCLMEEIQKEMLRNKKEWVNMALGKPVLSERVMKSIYANLNDLISIPQKQEDIGKQLAKEKQNSKILAKEI